MILDHAGESTFAARLASGAKVGLSVCMDKMPPEPVAGLIFPNGLQWLDQLVEAHQRNGYRRNRLVPAHTVGRYPVWVQVLPTSRPRKVLKNGLSPFLTVEAVCAKCP